MTVTRVATPAVNVVTASRLIGAVYHNTTGRELTVAVAINSPAVGANSQILSDTANPPATPVGQSGCPATYDAPLTATVLPGNYYKVVSTDPAATIDNWVESLL